MANKAIDALAFCPFYVCEAKTTITCEGIVGAFTISKFENEHAKREHEKNFCTGRHCQGCGVYCSLMQNYCRVHKLHGEEILRH
ncbi:MAG: hypothetical protein KHW59_03435 [Clostridiales bacterium]|nr:hypothetical protein [Clostridiales bacterium]